MFQIKADSGRKIPASMIHAFQENMKTLSDENYIRLRREIEETGFSFAVHVWENDSKYYCLDGHQRLECVRRMSLENVNFDPHIPIVLVEAESWVEAKRKCLAAASQYGQFNTDGLVKMLDDTQMTNLDADAHFRFPEINIMGLGNIIDSDEEGSDPNEEYIGMPEFENEDLKPKRQLIISFKNDDDVAAFANLIQQQITEKTRSLWYPQVEHESMMDKRY